MYTIDEIKRLAAVCTIYTEKRPRVSGFIHWTGDQAIYCHPVGDGYTWTINGERVSEDDVRRALSTSAVDPAKGV